MSITQGRSKRKSSGGRYKDTRAKRVHALANSSSKTEIGDEQIKARRTRGGSKKAFYLQVDTVNLYKPSDEAHVEAELLNVVESPSNQNYVRRNIVTKGCVVETNEGKARITSRPGQGTALNAVLLE